jgi:hypothetical protein
MTSLLEDDKRKIGRRIRMLLTVHGTDACHECTQFAAGAFMPRRMAETAVLSASIALKESI